MADSVVSSQRRQRAERRAHEALVREPEHESRREQRRREVDEFRLLARSPEDEASVPAASERVPSSTATSPRPPGTPPPPQRSQQRPVPEGPAVVASRPKPKRLPWEGADADDGYNRGIAAMMREVPGSRR